MPETNLTVTSINRFISAWLFIVSKQYLRNLIWVGR